MEHATKRSLFSLLLILCASIACLTLYETPSKPQSISWDKEEVWSFNTDSPIITTPILVNENIVVRTNDQIIALDKASGKISWEAQSSAYSKLMDDYAIPRQLTGNSQYLVVGEESNSIGIYSMTTGSPLWKTVTDINFINDIQIKNNIMIVARHDHELAAYDLDSKRKLWDTKVPGPTNLSIAADTRVVVLAAGQLLQVYDLESGELLEATDYFDAVTGELTLDGSTIFLVYNPEEGEGLTVESLQFDSLARNWAYQVGVIGHPNLYLADHQLYLYDQALVSVDKNTGMLLWKEDSQDFYSKPVVYDDYLYFISKDGIDKNLCRLEITTGKLTSCARLETAGLTGTGDDLVAPLVADNMLIVSHNAEIVAYRIVE